MKRFCELFKNKSEKRYFAAYFNYNNCGNDYTFAYCYECK